MRARIGFTAMAMTSIVVLASCGIPDEPSVARQANSSSTSPLTISTQWGGSSAGGSAGITLNVSAVDNGEWDGEQRPDSRVNGFHSVTLTPARPSVSRIFSIGAVEDAVSFYLTGTMADPPREILGIRLSYRSADGWYVAMPGGDPIRFGDSVSDTYADVDISTGANPPTVVVSITGLP